MNTTNRNILISCVVLLVVFCLCLSVVVVAGAGLILITSREVSSLNLQPLMSSPPTADTVEGQMDQIQDQVIELRGLNPTSTVNRTLLSQEQLRQHVYEDLLEDYSPEEAIDDARVLSAFGLLSEDFDLYNFYQELYSEQIAGFYDQETKEMYVVQGEGFAGPERLTYAHEYIHVLQDQTYDIENGLNYNDESCEQDSERCAAIQALIEGDASYAEFAWYSENSTAEDRRQIAEFYTEFQSPVYDNAPAFMREDFVFPYEAGQEFVKALYEQGGWEAVNAAYANLPVSTEQILHPERYPEDMPEPVTLPDFSGVLGDGWSELEQGVMGEWYTYLILAYGLDEQGRLDIDRAKQAADGWEGDAYKVYYNESLGEPVVLLRTLWDSPSEAEEFANAFSDYATERFGNPVSEEEGSRTWQDGRSIINLRQEAETTTWVFAPDSSTAQLILDSMPSP